MRIFYLIIILFLIVSCNNDQSNYSNQITADLISPKYPPIIEFKDLIFNFDTVALGSKVEHTFVFKNIGKTSLLINSW